MGETITPDQTAFLQSKVDKANTRFLADLMTGRGLAADQLEAVSDGRWWSAAEAVGLGLIDQIGGLGDVLTAIRSKFGSEVDMKETLTPATAQEPSAAVEVSAAAQTGTPVPAAPGLAQYMAAFGDAEGAKMFLAGTSWPDAQAAQLETLRGSLQDAQAEISQLKGQLANVAAEARGVASPVAVPQGQSKARGLADVSKFRG